MPIIKDRWLVTFRLWRCSFKHCLQIALSRTGKHCPACRTWQFLVDYNYTHNEAEWSGWGGEGSDTPASRLTGRGTPPPSCSSNPVPLCCTASTQTAPFSFQHCKQYLTFGRVGKKSGWNTTCPPVAPFPPAPKTTLGGFKTAQGLDG